MTVVVYNMNLMIEVAEVVVAHQNNLERLAISTEPVSQMMLREFDEEDFDNFQQLTPLFND